MWYLKDLSFYTGPLARKSRLFLGIFFCLYLLALLGLLASLESSPGFMRHKRKSKELISESSVSMSLSSLLSSLHLSESSYVSVMDNVLRFVPYLVSERSR